MRKKRQIIDVDTSILHVQGGEAILPLKCVWAEHSEVPPGTQKKKSKLTVEKPDKDISQVMKANSVKSC